MVRKIKDAILRFVHKSIYKPGHYYSTVPSLEEIEENKDAIFKDVLNVPDVDLREQEQLELLKSFKDVENDIQFPKNKNATDRYFYDNSFFMKGDAVALLCIIRTFNPKKIIEVGSGFSSCVCLDINERLYNNAIDLTFIEPYPERLYSVIKEKDKESLPLIQSKIQQVDLEIFKQLDENDILFIDSSHVSKIGSDLNHIMFNILPVLKKGVVIHFHDICFPFEYPKQWIDNGVFWNEAYLLRAFLMNNTSYKMLLWCHFVAVKHEAFLKENLTQFNLMGGSFWIQKTA